MHLRSARLLVAAAAAGVVLLGTASASAAGLFVWQADQSAPAPVDWSNGANWQGGAAPTAADGVADLTFPAGPCMGAITVCSTAIDDIPNLAVGTLTLTDVDQHFLTPLSLSGPTLPGASGYTIQGTTPLTIDGGIDVPTSYIETGCCGIDLATTFVDAPLILGAPNAWSVDQDGYLSADGGITGEQPLEIGGGGGIGLSGTDEVGPVTILTPFASIGPGDLNGTDAEPVTIDSDVELDGVSLGPLAFTGSGSADFGFGGVVTVNGALTLTGQTFVAATLDQTQAASSVIAVSGAANLESAPLGLEESGCVTPGTIYSLVKATGGIVGIFTNPTDGTPITNGEVITPDAAGCPSQQSPEPVTINYTADEVTATVAGATPFRVQPPAPAPTPTSSTPAPTSTPTSSSSAGSGAPASTSTAVVTPTLAIAGSVLAKTDAVSVTLRCTATAGSECAATGKLTSVETLKGGSVTTVAHARRKTTRRTVVDGSTSTAIPAGSSATLTVKLDAGARELLAKFHKLPVDFTVTLGSGSTSTTVTSETLTLRPLAGSRKHGGH